MPLTAEWVRQNIAGETLTLNSELVGLGEAGKALFGAGFLGEGDWSVRLADRDPASLAVWGSAMVRGGPRDVEVRFLTGRSDPEVVLGLIVYIDLKDDWASREFGDLGLGPLKSFGLSKPEAAYIIDAGRRSASPSTEGCARYGAGAKAAVNRFCVRRTSPGYSDLYSRFGSEESQTDLVALVKSLPFFKTDTPAVEVPDQVEDAVRGLSLRLSYAQVTVREDSRNIVSSVVSVTAGAIGGSTPRSVEIIPGIFWAKSLSVTLQLSGRSKFVISADFKGTIGSTDAEVTARYASGGHARIRGAVRNVRLDPVIKDFLTQALGADAEQVLTFPTVESMAVEANVSPKGTAFSGTVEVRIPLDGAHGDAFFAVTGSKMLGPSGTASASAALNFPLPSEDDPGRRLSFTGGFTQQGGKADFNLGWRALGGAHDPEVRLSDFLRLQGEFGSDGEGVPDIALSAVSAVYRPSEKFLLMKAEHPHVQIVLSVLE